MGALHDALERSGYVGHDLERFLVRLLFCLFADDTGIFEPRDIMLDLIEQRTPEERRRLGGHYTTEKNILKVIGPLFLDDLRQEFETLKARKRDKAKLLYKYHEELGSALSRSRLWLRQLSYHHLSRAPSA
jgi:hypothetical protein